MSLKNLFKQLMNWVRNKDMSQQTEVEKLKTKLLALCQQEDGFVATINGEWGVGKTHFWNDFVEENLKNKDVAYVSLFGKESLKEIQSSILIQISKRAKWVGKLAEITGNTKVSGIDVSSVLSIVDKTDFQDVIVCFDDFERSSEKLKDQDILGLISELKEQKNCKVIMIYNQDKTLADELSIHKDKIIDYEFHFKPTTADSYKHIEQKLKCFKEYPLVYFEEKNITNIRVMKRVVNALNDFRFTIQHLENFPDIESEVAYTIIKSATCNAQDHNYSLSKLVSYAEAKRNAEQNNEFKTDERTEVLLSLFNVDSRYFLPNDMMKNIDRYIQTSIPKDDELIAIINERKHQVHRYEVEHSSREIHTKLNYDFKYSLMDYANDMFNLFHTHKDYIVEVVNPASFIFYIDEIRKIDSSKDYHLFGVECLKKYLSDTLVDKSLNSIDHFGNLQKMLDFDESIQKHIDAVLAKKDKEQIASKEDVFNLLSKPRKDGYSSDEAELLMLVDDETYIQYIKEEPEFFKETISFIHWAQKLGGGDGFKKVSDKLVLVFREINKQGNSDISYKINRALDYLNRQEQVEES